MFLSNRETILLTEFINSDTPVSLDQMMSLLKVSKRTIYRELANLEVSLKSIEATIEKVSRGSYQLKADQKAFIALQEIISSNASQTLSTTERQHAILLRLLTTPQPISMQFFLDTYQISNTTFFADIRQLEESLARLPLKIQRNRGYEIEGSEKQRRLLLANTLVMEINEYQFFHIAELVDKETYFLQFVNRQHLIFAQQLVLEMVEPKFLQLSDRKLEFIILMLAIAMDRCALGFSLAEETYVSQINKELLSISRKIFTKVAEETKPLYPVNEIVFFALLLGDFANSFDHDFFDDNFDTDLAYRVKRLIKLVSDRTEVHFFEDVNLYKMLLTHISGVLTRTILEEETLNNPILEKIMAQYMEIAESIRQELPQVFPQQLFSEEEIAYMVLHFANSLEKSPKVMEINIAGISPSGLASTSMLEMQLRKHFPFINEIKFFRVGDIERLNIEDQYDLVISTALLAGYHGNYKLVSPLLLEDEIHQLQEEFKKISQKKQSPRRTAVSTLEDDSYEEMLSLMAEINQLLAHFSIMSIKNPTNLLGTLTLLMHQIEDSIVKDRPYIAEKLLDRYHQAPIGIPNTHMALFHASSEKVTTPIFRIFDLETSFKLIAMDKEEILVSRFLIMLAPFPISEDVGKILGKISGSIIMNDLNMEIFNSGNQSIVYQLLSSLLIEEIKR